MTNLDLIEHLEKLHQTQETIRLLKHMKLKLFDLDVLVIAYIEMLTHNYELDKLDSKEINIKLLQIVKNSINYIYEDITNYSLEFYEEIEKNNFDIIKFYPYKMLSITKKVNEITRYINTNKDISSDKLYKILNIIRKITHVISYTKEDFYELVELIQSDKSNLDKIKNILKYSQTRVDNINSKVLSKQLNIS